MVAAWVRHAVCESALRVSIHALINTGTHIIFASRVHAVKEAGLIQVATQPLLLTRYIVLFVGTQQPLVDRGLFIIEASHHTQTHHTR